MDGTRFTDGYQFEPISVQRKYIRFDGATVLDDAVSFQSCQFTKCTFRSDSIAMSENLQNTFSDMGRIQFHET